MVAAIRPLDYGTETTPPSLRRQFVSTGLVVVLTLGSLVLLGWLSFEPLPPAPAVAPPAPATSPAGTSSHFLPLPAPAAPRGPIRGRA